MMQALRNLGAMAALAALASCGEKPAPDPASVAAVVIQLPAMPVAPAWAATYLGKPIKRLFPAKTPKKCYGNVDAVAQSDDPAAPVAHFTGWAWDDKHSSAFDMVLAVNGDGIVVGAGEVSIDRPDVINAAPDRVTNPKVGFDVSSSQTNGSVTLYGVQKMAGSRCQVGTGYTF